MGVLDGRTHKSPVQRSWKNTFSLSLSNNWYQAYPKKKKKTKIKRLNIQSQTSIFLVLIAENFAPLSI